MTSAKVFPMQMRFPPLNAQNANGLLGLPSGLLYIGDDGSNLSGLNISG